ncbi:MAG TPA: GNAT family N-acetyltransferase [Roseiflexaceae bacterium]|nr:GNAT family N-acetyltransferase [Roseiflexaceae bacterium]
MTMTIRQVSSTEIEQVVPLLLLAEPSERALRWGLQNLSDTVYRAEQDGVLVAACTMQWRNDPAELMELGVAPEQQGRGLGRAIIAWLVEEAGRRGRRELQVGTTNSNLRAIAFYQKCGFRMDSVRRDYFRYYREPHYENGIQVRDMLVFRYQVGVNG